MKDKFVVAYEAPYMWKAAVLEAEGCTTEAAHELVPYFTDPLRSAENRRRFSKEELKALESANPTNGSVLVRVEPLGGAVSYRPIISAGKSVDNFCEQNFNAEETQAMNLVRDFLCSLGASDVVVVIDRSVEETKSRGMEVMGHTAGGKKNVVQGSVDASGHIKEGANSKRHVNVRGQVERNDADYDHARKMLAKYGWMKSNFEGLCSRAERGLVHGKVSDKISKSNDSDFTENAGVAVSVVAKYGLINGAVKTEMEKTISGHKNETIVLTWSCMFPG